MNKYIKPDKYKYLLYRMVKLFSEANMGFGMARAKQENPDKTDHLNGYEEGFFDFVERGEIYLSKLIDLLETDSYGISESYKEEINKSCEEYIKEIVKKNREK